MTVRVAVTGAAGFLGWHVRCHARTRDDVEVVPVARHDFTDPGLLSAQVSDCDSVVHLAGFNRASDAELEHGNEGLAHQLTTALDGSSVKRVVHANSVHRDTDTAYGRGKARASHVFSQADAELVDVVLPHLFGEHGRPGYNSFVATFAHAFAVGSEPTVRGDDAVHLLHAQDAARLLLDAAVHGAPSELRPAGHPTTVSRVATTLRGQAATYAGGLLPDLRDPFEARLFNQLRSYARPFSTADDRRSSRFDQPARLPVRPDDRGTLVEAVRGLGGQTQAFFSTTRPGVTRGNHFHTHKVERFVVVSGRARVDVRRLGDRLVHRFEADGCKPVSIDMPTLHTHAITNIGSDELLTLFWADEVFDAVDADTFSEPVEPAP